MVYAQAYFEGAWRILERRQQLSFDLLHAATVSLEEHDDAMGAWMKYQAKIPNHTIRFQPRFLSNMAAYMASLDYIAEANGVPFKGRLSLHGPRSLRSADTQLLLSRKAGRTTRQAQPLRTSAPAGAGGKADGTEHDQAETKAEAEAGLGTPTHQARSHPLARTALARTHPALAAQQASQPDWSTSADDSEAGSVERTDRPHTEHRPPVYELCAEQALSRSPVLVAQDSQDAAESFDNVATCVG
jgi:hypothetical protein